MSLAALAGPGFTSLPVDEAKLHSMLAGSRAAAGGADGAIVLAMSERRSGAIAGCAAVKRGGPKRPGFANFRILDKNDGSAKSLQISDDYCALTEIGALFVHPDFRSGGAGKALAQSRYMYIATAPHSFGDTVFAELRGVIGADGDSPFFEAACRPWLGMSFMEADRICASGENDRLVAMLPAQPISTRDFPDAALHAIGACHDSGKAARAMLEREGFRFDGVIDLLDGGALVAAKTKSLTSLRLSRTVHLKSAPEESGDQDLLFATMRATSFRCISGRGSLTEDAVICSERIRSALEISDGELVNVSPLSSRATSRTSNPNMSKLEATEKL